MSYLIIGSNSFVRSPLVNHLLTHELKVIGVSRSHAANQLLLAHTHHSNIQLFQFYQYDINKHFSELTSLIKNGKPSFVIDFAGGCFARTTKISS